MTAMPLPVVDERPVDHEDGRLAHYCRKDEILKATVDGVPIQALCGKVWVPDRDPSRYPVCATCEHVLGQIKAAGSN